MLGLKLLALWTVCMTLCACAISAQEIDRYVCRPSINIMDSNFHGQIKPRDCDDIWQQGQITTGTYTIYPQSDLKGYLVRCDMDSNSPGWTVIQRRISNSDFYKKWNEYQVGFGDLHTNFWLGNQLIHLLTSQAWYELRVELTSMDNKTAYAEYQFFSVGDAESKYKLLLGGYSGNAGDALAYHNGMKFSTNDQDNDLDSRDCAEVFVGAWWYNKCHESNLNGLYGNTEYAKGPVWFQLKGFYSPMKMTEMKIRRRILHFYHNDTGVPIFVNQH